MSLASRFAPQFPILRSDRPLSDDRIRAVVPSIFADAPHGSRSDRYAYIPTSTVLTKLRQSAGQDIEGGCGQLRARAAHLKAPDTAVFSTAPVDKAVHNPVPLRDFPSAGAALGKK